MLYNFIIPKPFIQIQNTYFSSLSEKHMRQFLTAKQIFQTDIFSSQLHTHKICTVQNICVYTSYLIGKDRLIFFFKDPNNVYLYTIMTDHDYKKL